MPSFITSHDLCKCHVNTLVATQLDTRSNERSSSHIQLVGTARSIAARDEWETKRPSFKMARMRQAETGMTKASVEGHISKRMVV
jgi:hypothetical protein